MEGRWGKGIGEKEGREMWLGSEIKKYIELKMRFKNKS